MNKNDTKESVYAGITIVVVMILLVTLMGI